MHNGGGEDPELVSYVLKIYYESKAFIIGVLNIFDFKTILYKNKESNKTRGELGLENARYGNYFLERFFLLVTIVHLKSLE